ncbi:MAG: hypothetical protein IJA32_07355 [Lachnospiraceae bacterium]|nr:hypothetical protein [Lachnospiraceae bacterium]
MLSVLLLILKIILLTIAILLGIVILLLLSFLFLPFCYQFYGKYENEGYIEGSVRWILFVIHFKTTYEHEELTYDLKSFGYTIYSNREEWQEKHKKKIRFRKTKEEKKEKTADGNKNRRWDKNQDAEISRNPKETKQLLKDVDKNLKTKDIRKKETILSKCAVLLGKVRLILQKIWGIFSYLFYFPWKIKESIFLGIEKIAELWKKIKPVIGKIKVWKKFLKQKSTKEAFKHILSHLKFLWKGIKPKKFYGELHFGFDEPDKTGMVLGVIGSGYCAIRKYVKIIPYFDEKILKGSFYGKGSIQIFHIVKTGLRVYKDKLLMKKWKQIEKLMEQ